ncbi:site-specific DNA-methyltransferase [bacterium (Candidatus Gribaldobacteria) CG08_land_8_20_14_0_20_39_15]|uniref:Methyltransferase n=1 Tax=bacterium (Candidatus Gribaldobacteria) CG08_land_8_20_14_0_20_39_15 TaxID=2014273 RepID=A0A2M6XU67_9BACT|nr:MAG: site-specific DNA-methyltransferase [bacterium (Candidatus Gribaldobacteria) CG08_land_8_20_14_0_20_39_15]
MLTKKQKIHLDYITKFIEKNGYAPSVEEIKKHFHLASKSTAHQQIATLTQKGYLIKENYKARGISIIQDAPLSPADTYTPFTPLSYEYSIGKERKVKDRFLKERFRGGTKNLNHSVEIKSSIQNLEKFINKIICGDSKKVLSEMPDNSVDIIITSPPYNFGLDYKSDNKNDTKKWIDYFNQLNEIWQECVRILKPGGRFCVNVQPLFSDYIPTHHLVSKQLLDLGLLWKGEIIWEKNNYNCKYTAWGSWKSPSMPYLKYSWEFIEVFCKETHKKTGEAKNIDITADEFKKWVYGKWSIAPERNMKKYEHPAMFPEELVARLLKLFSYKNDFVLDPFNGAGTTTAVAKKLSRRYLGIDMAPEYCKTAKDRLTETLF